MSSREYKTGREYGGTTTRIPVTMYVDREPLASLDSLAAELGRTRADLVREAVQRLLVTYAPRAPAKTSPKSG